MIVEADPTTHLVILCGDRGTEITLTWSSALVLDTLLREAGVTDQAQVKGNVFTDFWSMGVTNGYDMARSECASPRDRRGGHLYRVLSETLSTMERDRLRPYGRYRRNYQSSKKR